MIDRLPGGSDVHLQRYIVGVHVAGLLLAGIGAVTVIRALVETSYFGLLRRRPAVAVALTLWLAAVAPVILGQHIPTDRVKAIVRNGGLQMPPISTDQVSDEELEALAPWVSAHDAPKAQ